MAERTPQEIAKVNDYFRKRSPFGCYCVITQGVRAIMDKYAIEDLTPEKVQEIWNQVRNFNDFNNKNDPWGEHDFGSFVFDGNKYFWKIDYYGDKDYTEGTDIHDSESPVFRVLTLMLAEEY